MQLLMALRNEEAESVVIRTEDRRIVVLELDDGELLEFDRRELMAALEANARDPNSGPTEEA